jgi:RNA polymerase-binding transcription factor DksA
MNQEQRTHLEQRLLKERERTLRSLSQFDEIARIAQRAEDGDLTIYPLHLADEGTDTMEREKEFLLASKEGRQLYWIDAALRRAYRDPASFGLCLECQREISFERLDIVPWARLCVDCQREEEGRWRAAA